MNDSEYIHIHTHPPWHVQLLALHQTSLFSTQESQDVPKSSRSRGKTRCFLSKGKSEVAEGTTAKLQRRNWNTKPCFFGGALTSYIWPWSYGAPINGTPFFVVIVYFLPWDSSPFFHQTWSKSKTFVFCLCFGRFNSWESKGTCWTCVCLISVAWSILPGIIFPYNGIVTCIYP